MAKARKRRAVPSRKSRRPRLKTRAGARLKVKAGKKVAPRTGASVRHHAKRALPTKAAAKASAPAGSRPQPRLEPLFTREELRDIRERLSALLKQLQTNIQQEVRGAGDRDLAHITDTSDMASDAAEGELAFRIAESEGVAATEVQKAIDLSLIHI